MLTSIFIVTISERAERFLLVTFTRGFGFVVVFYYLRDDRFITKMMNVIISYIIRFCCEHRPLVCSFYVTVAN